MDNLSDKEVQNFNKKLLGMTIHSLFILQLLIRSPDGLVGKSLHESVNAFLKSKEGVPTSTFYNILTNMEEDGLITSNRIKEGKLFTYTSLGQQLVHQVAELSFFGSISVFDYVSELFPKLEHLLGQAHFNHVLAINLEEAIETNSINILTQISDNVSLVADDDTFSRYQSRNLHPNVKQTRIEHGLIREPANFFDGCSIIGFQSGRAADISHHDWLKEAIRVIKPGGMIMISSVEKIPHLDHFLIEHMINRITSTDYIRQMSKENLKQELEQEGLSDIQIFTHKGILVGIGIKREKD